ncbi:hypothetical protein DFH09DRAFT_1104632 [Mycena vulgaris]|nr:hypothetical protein DFH09DRAFT_1104632 [Mycena vulgaris]
MVYSDVGRRLLAPSKTLLLHANCRALQRPHSFKAPSPSPSDSSFPARALCNETRLIFAIALYQPSFPALSESPPRMHHAVPLPVFTPTPYTEIMVGRTRLARYAHKPNPPDISQLNSPSGGYGGLLAGVLNSSAYMPRIASKLGKYNLTSGEGCIAVTSERYIFRVPLMAIHHALTHLETSASLFSRSELGLWLGSIDVRNRMNARARWRPKRKKKRERMKHSASVRAAEMKAYTYAPPTAKGGKLGWKRNREKASERIDRADN